MMRQTTLSLLLPLLLLVGCGGGEAPVSEEPQIDKAVLMQVDSDPTISFTLWIAAGSQDDPAGKEGLAALTAQMIASGATTSDSYEQILEKLYPLASSYNVRVDKEMTTLTGRTHRDNLDAFFGLFTNAYLNPAFDEADFERLQTNQLNAIKTSLRYADDEELGKAALMQYIFAGQRYAHPIAGTVAGVESITLDDVRSFYQSRWSQARATIALGGGFSTDLAQKFRATLDELPAGEPANPPTIAAEPFEGHHLMLVQKDGADASISFGFPITAQRGERDYYALWLANSWLGEHRNQSSHLYQVIREARGMNYGDYSYIEAFPEGGRRQMPPANVARNHQIFQIWIRTLPNEQAHFAVRAALRELQKLVDEGMSQEDFELTQAFLAKYHLHYATTTQGRLGYAVDDHFYGLQDWPHLERFGEIVGSLTLEEVNAAIKKHLQVENVKIAIATGDAEGLKKSFVADAPSPISYPSDKPAEVLSEDKLIEVHPLNVAEENVTIVSIDEIFGE